MNNWRKKKTVIIILIFICIYSFIHELGHSIVVIVMGGKLTEFNPNPLNAHMHYIGNFTNVELSIINAGGVALPWIIWIIFILICHKKASNILEYIKLVTSVIILGSMLPWIIIPIIGNRPLGDDVTKFLNFSRLNPISVSVVSFGLFLFNIFIALLKIERISLARIKKVKSDINAVK